MICKQLFISRVLDIKIMTKGILFVGPERSGKTRKAQEIADQYQKDEVTWIYYFDSRDKFAFTDCSKKTKLIIIEDFRKIEDVTAFYNCITDGINGGLLVEKQCKHPYYIAPKILIVSHPKYRKEDFLKMGLSFERRFDIIEFENPKP